MRSIPDLYHDMGCPGSLALAVSEVALMAQHLGGSLRSPAVFVQKARGRASAAVLADFMSGLPPAKRTVIIRAARRRIPADGRRYTHADIAALHGVSITWVTKTLSDQGVQTRRAAKRVADRSAQRRSIHAWAGLVLPQAGPAITPRDPARPTRRGNNTIARNPPAAL